MQFMRRASLIGLLCLVALLSAACQPVAPDAQGGEPVAVRLRLDWIPGAEHAAYYVAQDLGYYREAGLDVTIDEGSGSSDSARLLGTNEIQFGIVDAAALVSARSEGIPIVSVAVIYQDTPISLAWLADKRTLNAPADLAGLTIGANPNSTHYIGMEAFLQAQGLADDVTIIPIGFVGMEPLLTGQVDTQMGFITSDPPLISAQGNEPGYFLVKDYGVQMYGLTIATNETYLRDNPELVKGFVQASLRGWQYLIDNPSEAIELQRKYVSELDPTELGLERLGYTLPLVQTPATEANGLGWQDEAKWAATQQTLVDHGVVSSPTDVSAMFSNIAFEE